jgi:hypothetical protein
MESNEINLNDTVCDLSGRLAQVTGFGKCVGEVRVRYMDGSSADANPNDLLKVSKKLVREIVCELNKKRPLETITIK